jgi:hypothetical protein
MSNDKLDVPRINVFINDNFTNEDRVVIRGMFFHLITRRLQGLFIEDLNKVIMLEDVMDDPGTEAFKIIKKVYDDNKI